uniref:Alcohol dehydrogenase n=1 Tax=Sphingomonas sp. JE1 TaxID=1628059 RepID=A0A0D4ZZQ0_9SPHN|nr:MULTISPECIES: zinc-binding dehydrogenase [unclassified Sphingomonas]AJW29515.1 alcohol dehydrogenase [Sphingomonas sp. JE1]
MFAVYADQPDDKNPLNALVIGEQPEPEPQDGWVKVRMIAASLNWHDLWTLRGMGAANGRPERFPMILGCDGVGTLDDGSHVVIYPMVGSPDWKGDETLDPERQNFSEYLQGTMADYAFVPRRNAVPLPEGISTLAGSVLGASWITAYRMLFTHSSMRAGQTMLVQGGLGGVASALIQMGKAAGMRVWTTVRTEEKRALAVKLGAQEAFLDGAPLPGRVDAVFEPVGAATWAHSMAAVKAGGTIVVCGLSSGSYPPLDLARIFIEQITIKGVTAGTLDEFRDMLAFIQTAGIEPHVGHLLPMSEAREGLALMTSGNMKGKIVLQR